MGTIFIQSKSGANRLGTHFPHKIYPLGIINLYFLTQSKRLDEPFPQEKSGQSVNLTDHSSHHSVVLEQNKECWDLSFNRPRPLLPNYLQFIIHNRFHSVVSNLVVDTAP
jgi:hypothetical protein